MFRTLRISDPRFERDHLRYLTVKSRALKGRGDMTVFVPPGVPVDASLPVVVLLHGVYGSHWSWAFGAGVHWTAMRLIEEGTIRPMLLAMPSDGLWGDGSGYLPHPEQDFEWWIVEEVPAALAEALGPGLREAPRFIAGLSMGGFGALRLGAKYGSWFRGISGHSSITHFDQMAMFVEEDLAAYQAPESDRSVLNTILTHRTTLPPLRFDCGTDDPLIDANRALHDQLNAAEIPHMYEEFAGGHEWPYWARSIARTLQFFDERASGGPR